MNCRVCAHSFRQTSWTSSADWLRVCPKCIVRLLNKMLAQDPELQKKTGFEVQSTPVESAKTE